MKTKGFYIPVEKFNKPMTSSDYFIIKAEERNVDLTSRVLQMYFEFRDNKEDFSDIFLEAFALHLKLNLDIIKWVYDSGREEVKSLLIAHPEYVVVPTLDERH